MIGLMSGSSLDGLDIAYTIIETGVEIKFKIVHAKTYAYDDAIKNYLRNINISKSDYSEEENYFAEISATFVNQFIKEYQIQQIDFIASHGHTVYHYPEKKATLQIGDGKVMSQLTKLTVINNFRQKDMDAGGQGAPLVPVCDELFFNYYHACLNIGGIANISFKKNEKRIGFDICGANQILNACAAEVNLEFDKDGEIAGSGKADQELLYQLNSNSYFKMGFPKSLDNQFVRKNFTELILHSGLIMADKLATANFHIAEQIANVIQRQQNTENISPSNYKLLVTGGGAKNNFLIQSIEKLASIQIELPSEEIIDFKEALAIALMGVLRMENKPNFLTSVTGAEHAVSGGDIYLYKK